MKIISGGQSGADLGGIFFAKKHNIACKINIFKDFRPISDNLPTDVEIECVCDVGNYINNLRKRTEYNVQNSDFTLILLNKDIQSTNGSKLTYNLCLKLKKDVLYININTFLGGFHDKTWSRLNHMVIQNLNKAKQIIKSKNPGVLNIAGQRDLDKSNVIWSLEILLERMVRDVGG